jgi:hypothetical protein
VDSGIFKWQYLVLEAVEHPTETEQVVEERADI